MKRVIINVVPGSAWQRAPKHLARGRADFSYGSTKTHTLFTINAKGIVNTNV
jgi:hypothetical protein